MLAPQAILTCASFAPITSSNQKRSTSCLSSPRTVRLKQCIFYHTITIMHVIIFKKNTCNNHENT
ncbi:hypothetical protein Hanom_Chr05g00444101 [Helianthus anomalus]